MYPSSRAHAEQRKVRIQQGYNQVPRSHNRCYTGVRPDPDKLRAIKEMKQPSCVNELRRFHGMVNQTSKFCPQLADKTKPLRDLLSTKNQWIWGHPQDEAFQNVIFLCSTQVLAH